MHAMHIDACSEWMLGKTHDFFADMPNPSKGRLENGRDGVPVEEDLAL